MVSSGPPFLAKVENLTRSVQGVLGIHELRAVYIEPDTARAGMHIAVQRGLPIEEADRIAHEVRERIQKVTGCRYCTIHMDPVKIEALRADVKTTRPEEPPGGPTPPRS